MTKIKSPLLKRAFTIYSKDKALDLNDGLKLIRLAQRSGITAREKTDLRLIGQIGRFTSPGRFAFYKVVSGKIAQIPYLIDKWFFGRIKPDANVHNYSAQYEFVNGVLFKNGTHHTDINQGFSPNCSFLVALGVLAEYKNSYVQNLIIHKKLEGQDVYFVRFIKWDKLYWVAVDGFLPSYQGLSLFASDNRVLQPFSNSSELWVSLLEKAYVQFKGASYAQIITGIPESLYHLTGKQVSVRTTYSKALGIVTKRDGTPSNYGLINDHAYLVLSDSKTLYNPWGNNAPNSPYSSLQEVTRGVEYYITW